MKKIIFICALSVSFLIQANTKEISEIEETNFTITKIKAIDPEVDVWAFRCKSGTYNVPVPAGTDFMTVLAMVNDYCNRVDNK
ncbi:MULTISPECIES: hypothetical protein [Flavobacterium]|uniref:Uncharacterized protein n=1 Tax=Flavobacterium jumunjinense TaxID=998845 RepID=A0ABV5GL01_9FLAO|nr:MULTISPECIES: hypothetical protein [Flavobacterium]